MVAVDPALLAERQLLNDRQRTARFPFLLQHKIDRMAVSPLAFLRGAAPLYFEILAAHPILAEGPPGEGWLVGDIHLENFGVYRTAKPVSKGHDVTFNLNDFDDCIEGPWRFDVLRLTTSLLLGGRELGASGIRGLELCVKLLDTYVAAVFEGAEPKTPPRPVRALLEKVKSRSRPQFLEGRTEVVKGKRSFVIGNRYAELPPAVRNAVPAAFAAYVRSMKVEERPSPEHLEILDFALRIAGTGSLGGLRVAILVAGKGGPDGAWVFDLKEERKPAACALLPEPQVDPARRVLTGYRACVANSAEMLGTTELLGLPMFGRRLMPQEDKIELGQLRSEDLDDVAAYFGALLGTGHARGAVARPKKPWTAADREALLDRAIAMAGMHEAVYLAFCRLTSRKPGKA